MVVVDARGSLHDPSGRYAHRVRAMPVPLSAQQILDSTDDPDDISSRIVTWPPVAVAVARYDPVHDPAPF